MHTPEELLKAIIACSPDGYVSCDEFGKIVFVNETIERITGWSASELIGQDTSKIYSLPESLTSSAGEDGKIKPQAAILFRRDGKKITLKARQIEIKKISSKDCPQIFTAIKEIDEILSLPTEELDQNVFEFYDATTKHVTDLSRRRIRHAFLQKMILEKLKQTVEMKPGELVH